MHGTLPTELGRMTGLKHSLSFRQMPVSGVLPTEIGLLTQLKMADFGVTTVSGSVPSELGALTSTKLHLEGVSRSKISGTLPFEVAELPQMVKMLTKAGHAKLPMIENPKRVAEREQRARQAARRHRLQEDADQHEEAFKRTKAGAASGAGADKDEM